MPYFLDYERVSHHKSMLSDKKRTLAFRNAIRNIVNKGDVVADVGCGTGILSFFAAEAGAKKVYAIERTDMAYEAKEMAQDNWLTNVDVIKEDSSKVNLPEKCDVIISECIGYFVLQENMVNEVIDFRKRNLKESGRMIPESIEMYIAPVETLAFAEVNFWGKRKYGFDMREMRGLAANSSYCSSIKKRELLAEPKIIKKISMYGDEVVLDEGEEFEIKRDGGMNGLCGYFSAELCPGVRLSNAPGTRRTHWRQQYFPLEKPMLVTEGSTVYARIETIPHKGMVDWLWYVTNGEKYSAHSTTRGIRLKEQCFNGGGQ
ncbi:MAG: 50S ribosomal protein L11 methyltransferase [Candidatus Aenigmatarchaeota archaeon]